MLPGISFPRTRFPLPKTGVTTDAPETTILFELNGQDVPTTEFQNIDHMSKMFSDMMWIEQQSIDGTTLKIERITRRRYERPTPRKFDKNTPFLYTTSASAIFTKIATGFYTLFAPEKSTEMSTTPGFESEEI